MRPEGGNDLYSHGNVYCRFFFNDTATTEIYTLSLHDALPIWLVEQAVDAAADQLDRAVGQQSRVDHQLDQPRSEEHTSELQSRRDLVCRLLLEKKKKLTKDLLGNKKKYKTYA